MNSLDRILDGVTTEPTIAGSTRRLMHNIAAEVRNAVSNHEAVGHLATLLDREAGNMGDHVLASTPIFGTPLPVHPVPPASDSSKIPAPPASDADVKMLPPPPPAPAPEKPEPVAVKPVAPAAPAAAPAPAPAPTGGTGAAKV